MATDSKDEGMAQNAGEAMTTKTKGPILSDLSIEEATMELVHGIVWVAESAAKSENGRVSEAWMNVVNMNLLNFAAAIRKQAKADMTCLLLTRESEAMGGYATLGRVTCDCEICLRRNG